jgi:hypothetical protein
VSAGIERASITGFQSLRGRIDSSGSRRGRDTRGSCGIERLPCGNRRIDAVERLASVETVKLGEELRVCLFEDDETSSR